MRDRDCVIECKYVNKRYPTGHDALSQVSFTMRAGDMAFLTGHSGAGKSTLLKLIAHIEPPSSGQICVNGFQLNQLKPKHIPALRRGIGMVFQSPKLLKDSTIFDNVALPLRISGFPKQDIPRRVRAALDKVGLLKKERCLPDMLSGGEQQRIGIARAVVHRPKILLADEPTGNLDPALSQEIMSLFEAFNAVGVTVLIASHDLGLIASKPHRIMVLNHGRLSGAIG